ncbi:MAG: helix-turn-helix domain-containing protein [Desulfobacterium sp.]|nr:helix-turn-helix domain-containing protein [Desulfobacterium sp.]MBU3947344.1 helix-turn-helix domain-containing protein [Pseudomonadota bacterium]MBU4034972.1 helix-turn-helix domain-containing protein [Pseudomonadota bacterium]
MKLRVKDAAELLQVSEKTIYRWIAQEKLPMHQISGQYRFNRAELLEWATTQCIPISPKMMEEPEDAFIPSFVSPTIKAHLNLLSKLSLGLRSPTFAEVVARIGLREDIFRQAGLLDAQFVAKSMLKEERAS